MINRKQAIEVFESYGFSIKPLQFVAETYDAQFAKDGYVRFGFISIEPKSKDAVSTVQLVLLLKGNICNSFVIDAFTYYYTRQKLILCDEFSSSGDPGVMYVHFIGYKMKL